MPLPLVPILAGAAISGAVGTAVGWGLNEEKEEEPVNKKTARESIFPKAESAPFSFNGQQYGYSPDNSRNEQNENHQAYETYQPVVNYSPQITTQYPDYTVISNSPNSNPVTKKTVSPTQSTEQSPQWYQPSSFQPGYSQDKSTENGIDPMLFVYAALILGAAWVIGGVVTKR